MTLWQVRVHVPDDPGQLARLAGDVAALGGNIVSVAVHGCDERCVIDDLVVDLPPELGGDEVRAALGGADDPECVHLRRVRPHVLVDDTTRALHLVTLVDEGPHVLADLLVTLLGADGATVHAPGPAAEPALPPGACATSSAPLPGPGRADHRLRLPLPADRGTVELHRTWAPFTVTEIARAQALLQVAWQRAGGRDPASRHSPTDAEAADGA